VFRKVKRGENLIKVLGNSWVWFVGADRLGVDVGPMPVGDSNWWREAMGVLVDSSAYLLK